MEVFSLDCSSAETEVLVIQNFKANQPKLTRRWSAVSNLAQITDVKNRPRTQTGTMCNNYTEFMKERRSKALTVNAKKMSEEEMELLDIDIFKPLDFYEILFNRMKSNEKKTSTRCCTFDKVFIIRF